jgi:hypothetical protein
MKRSQIRLFESIAVLLIFVFFVAIGIRFYSNAQIRSLNEAATEFSELDAVKTTLVLSTMPEIACSFQGITDVGCLDLYKIISWEAIMSDPTKMGFLEHYIPLLGLSEITIEELYPHNRSWIIYNSSLGNFSIRVVGETRLQIPTTIFDPVTQKNSFGVLRVKTYMIQ